MIGKFLRLTGVLRDPIARRAVVAWRPFSIASYTLVAALKRMKLDFRTIIDAGANVGQFARAAAEIYPGSKVFSIEALPDAARKFRANMHDRDNVALHEVALGSRDGSLTFYPRSYSQASSALQVRPEHESKHADSRPLPPMELPSARLDTLFDGESLERPILLKLDLQGYELEALKGGPSLLTQCDYILIETVFEEAYEGEPLFGNVLDFLKEHGFDFVKPLNFLKDTNNSIYQMDALFARSGKPPR